MRHSFSDYPAGQSHARLLLAYVADLELEVDHLRKQAQLLGHEVGSALRRIKLLCADATEGGQPALAEIDRAVRELAAVLRDLQGPPGYHPAHDQVIAIALRPLAEQVFRWQQRLAGDAGVVLRLELQSEHIEWFPARLRHILDNLLSNALKYRDPAKGAAPTQAAGLGVGLAVVKLLVEQSGGSLTIDSGEGQGTILVAVLPRYDVDDYLT